MVKLLKLIKQKTIKQYFPFLNVVTLVLTIFYKYD